jgi:hypothetical protein
MYMGLEEGRLLRDDDEEGGKNEESASGGEVRDEVEGRNERNDGGGGGCRVVARKGWTVLVSVYRDGAVSAPCGDFVALKEFMMMMPNMTIYISEPTIERGTRWRLRYITLRTLSTLQQFISIAAVFAILWFVLVLLLFHARSLFMITTRPLSVLRQGTFT